jgi:hypothetical protein
MPPFLFLMGGKPYDPGLILFLLCSHMRHAVATLVRAKRQSIYGRARQAPAHLHQTVRQRNGLLVQP